MGIKQETRMKKRKTREIQEPRNKGHETNLDDCRVCEWGKKNPKEMTLLM